MMPRVSVLVAAYNAEMTIGATLQSLVRQTYDDWEAIVADDCSTDATVEVASGIDPRITVVRAERNGGHAAPTRNLAARHARGELIAFLDGDDHWLPEYLTTLVGAFDAVPNAAVVGCDAVLVVADGGRLDTSYLAALGAGSGPVTLDDLLHGNPVYASALIERAVFEQLGGLAEDLRGSDDYDLWVRIAELGRDILVLGEELAVYRIHDLQLSADQRAMSRATAEVYRRALSRGRLTRRQRLLARRSLLTHASIAALPALAKLSPRRAPRSRSR
jgi:glycosyltransferase involved in cell wall biosynthesis